jgi:predicted nucleic-acid-binding protein
MRSIDTNITLRLILRDVPEQLEKIFALIEKSKPAEIAVADAVFFECVWILTGPGYKFGRELTAKLILGVAAIPQINANRTMLARATSAWVKHPAISFIDACLAAYAELNNAVPLLTFDRKLASALPETVAKL